MREFLVSTLITALSLLIIDNFSRSINFRGGLKSVIILAVIIGFLNSTVRPVLQFLSIPITILTLGLYYFVVNGIVLYMAFKLTNGADIKGLRSAIWVNIVLTVLNSFITNLFN